MIDRKKSILFAVTLSFCASASMAGTIIGSFHLNSRSDNSTNAGPSQEYFYQTAADSIPPLTTASVRPYGQIGNSSTGGIYTTSTVVAIMTANQRGVFNLTSASGRTNGAFWNFAPFSIATSRVLSVAGFGFTVNAAELGTSTGWIEIETSALLESGSLVSAAQVQASGFISQSYVNVRVDGQLTTLTDFDGNNDGVLGASFEVRPHRLRVRNGSQVTIETVVNNRSSVLTTSFDPSFSGYADNSGFAFARMALGIHRVVKVLDNDQLTTLPFTLSGTGGEDYTVAKHVPTAPVPSGQIVAGDADFSGSVNFADLLSLAQNYGKTTDAFWSDGDFNNDGAVSFPDLLALAQNYGSGPSMVDGASAQFNADWQLARSMVPEPGTLGLFGVTGLLLRRRR